MSNRRDKIREEFIEQIIRDFAFLFREAEAKIVPNDRDYPRMFDNAIVIVVVDDLRFRFVRDRGEDRIDVSSVNAPEAWEELTFVLGIINRDQSNNSFWLPRSELLKANLPKLRRAYSRAEYEDTRKLLANEHKLKREKCVKAFNRKTTCV